MEEKQADAKLSLVLVTMPEGVPAFYEPACEAIVDSVNETTRSRLLTTLSYLRMDQVYKLKPTAIDEANEPDAYKLWEVDMPKLRAEITENTVAFSKTSARIEGGLMNINLSLHEAKSMLANNMRFEKATMGIVTEISKFSEIVDLLSNGVDEATEVTLKMLKAVANQAGITEYASNMKKLVELRKKKADLETSHQFFQNFANVHAAQADVSNCQSSLTHINNSIRVCQAAADKAADIASRANEEAYQTARKAARAVPIVSTSTSSSGLFLPTSFVASAATRILTVLAPSIVPIARVAANTVPIKRTTTSRSGFWFWRKTRTHVHIDNTPVENANRIKNNMETLKQLAHSNEAEKAKHLDRLVKVEKANIERQLGRANSDLEQARKKVRQDEETLAKYDSEITALDKLMQAAAKKTGIKSQDTTLMFLKSVNSLYNGIAESFVGANTLCESLKVVRDSFTRRFTPETITAFLEDPSRECGAILPALRAIGYSTVQNVRDLYALDDPDEVDEVMQELIAEVDQHENPGVILRENRNGEIVLKSKYRNAIKLLGKPENADDRAARQQYVIEAIDSFMTFVPHIHREFKAEIDRVGNIGNRNLLPEKERQLLIEYCSS